MAFNDLNRCVSQKFADWGTWDGTLAGLDNVLAKLVQDDSDYLKSLLHWDAVNLFSGKAAGKGVAGSTTSSSAGGSQASNVPATDPKTPSVSAPTGGAGSHAADKKFFKGIR